MGFLSDVLNAIFGNRLFTPVVSETWRFGWTGYTKPKEDSMLITVTRTNKVPNANLGIGLFGNLMIDCDPFKCLTLEREGVEIPPGVYPIQWVRSPHFAQIMPHIIVPNRIMILQHWANWPNQLEGCQALGTSEELDKDQLDGSKDAWGAYVDIILNQPNLTLKITEDYGSK